MTTVYKVVYKHPHSMLLYSAVVHNITGPSIEYWVGNVYIDRHVFCFDNLDQAKKFLFDHSVFKHSQIHEGQSDPVKTFKAKMILASPLSALEIEDYWLGRVMGDWRAPKGTLISNHFILGERII